MDSRSWLLLTAPGTSLQIIQRSAAQSVKDLPPALAVSWSSVLDWCCSGHQTAATRGIFSRTNMDASSDRLLEGTLMAPFKIGYFVGSLATGSINRVLANALIKLAPEDLEFTEILIRDLPLYSYDYDADFPPEGRALKEAIEASDGILFVSPEYNRSIPGALKNAIDWGSRPWGSNSFARKPTGIIGASVGSIGTAVMQSSFRSVLSFLDAPQLNAPEAYIHYDAAVFGEDGEVRNEGTAKFLRHFMDEYAAFVARVLAANAPGHIGDLEHDSAKLTR
jgi:chromate reductase